MTGEPMSAPMHQRLWREAAAAFARHLHRQQVRDIEARHGSLEHWRDECSPQHSADGELKLARILAHLMTTAPGRPRGAVRWERDRLILIADRDVAVYWACVVEGGDSAWAEERARITAHQRTAAVSSEWSERQAVLSDSHAIRALLPYYRQWGRALVKADCQPDLDKAFVAFR